MTSLKQLRYFEAVARLGHFGHAADQCAVTQPALSMQIQELEKDLGVQLVERRAKGAHLTESGREIARRASAILMQVQDLKDFARQRASPFAGPLNFGVIPTIAPYALPPMLPLIRDTYPDLDLRVRETHTQALVNELLDGALDVLLVALPIDHPHVETLHLFDDPFVLAAPRNRKIRRGIKATSIS